jgi:hypothetical protein
MFPVRAQLVGDHIGDQQLAVASVRLGRPIGIAAAGQLG